MALFRPYDAPSWLEDVLVSIEQSQLDLWPGPLRLSRTSTATLPSAAQYSQGLLYNITTGSLVLSNATTWVDLQLSTAALSALSGLVPAANKVPYFTGASTAALADFTAFGRSLVDDADAAAARATLVLGNVDNTSDLNKPVSTATQTALDAKQPLDTDLTAIAALTSAADKVLYATGAGTWALATLTAFARTLLDDADAAAVRGTLGLGTAATQNTGTSGDTVPKNNAANVFSASQTIDSGSNLIFADVGGTAYQGDIWHEASSPNRVMKYRSRGGSGGWIGRHEFLLSYDGGSDFTGATLTATAAAAVTLDVPGLVQCDTLRIDVTPTAATPTPTHTIPINVNGTVYRIPVVI